MNKRNLSISTVFIIIVSIVIASFAMSSVNNPTAVSGLFVKAYGQQQSLNSSLSASPIPNWIKSVAKLWSEGQTSDSDFLKTIQYLIDQNIIHTNQVSSLSSIASQNNATSKMNEMQTKYNTLQVKYNDLLQQLQDITAKQSLANSSISVDSISAVAVYPVTQGYGFFQTTSYNGTILKITVDVRDGTGLVLANTAIPEGVDFQNSAKIAAQVAQNVTGVDLSKKDVIFSITTDNQNLQAVDGGSAGGAMTVLLSSAILGKSINNHVLMTGTIQSDGTIGPIGAVLEKAQAAANYGAKIFLVPGSRNSRRAKVYANKSRLFCIPIM